MVRATSRPLVDEIDDRVVVALGRARTTGAIWDLRRDTVELGDGQTVVREYVAHPGAVGVIALDDADRVLLMRQYRHPVGHVAVGAARRAARRRRTRRRGTVRRASWPRRPAWSPARWDVLVDVEHSPGGSSETIRLYLARGLAPAPGGRPDRHGEERDMPRAWVPLDEAVAGVLAGRLTAPLTVAGVLAASVARAAGWATLRPVDARWPARAHVVGSGRARLYGSSRSAPPT